MRYEMFLNTTNEAARVTGGSIEVLAGDYRGIKLPAEGNFHLMLVLDMDDEDGWMVWRELAGGGRCCDASIQRLGWLRLDDLAHAAHESLDGHECLQ